MKSNRLLPTLFALSGLLVLALLTGCNMPGRGVEPVGIDVTQAYQTVQAQLTQAVAQTPIETTSPALTPLLEEAATQTPEIKPTTEPENPTDIPPSEKRCDQAAAAYPKIDITIEDDTEMVPDEEFTKIWRVVNVGTCTWTPEYDVVFFSGELMDAPVSLSLNTMVLPNQSVDLSVDMVAPNKAGTYQGNWKLRNLDGVLFGIGPNGESPFWVRIQVVKVATETPTSTPTLIPTTAVQANGLVTMVMSDTLNLDNLQVNAGGTDLEFRLTVAEPPLHQLVPLGNVIMGIYGDTQPELLDCQNAPMTGEAITLEDLGTSSYICYRTDLGLPGWARVDALNPEDHTVGLQILTWKLP
jgi:hypothetical protein